MELSKMARIARTRWKSIAAMVLLALILSATISLLMPRKYASSAQIYLNVETTSPSELYQASAYLTSRLPSYQELATQEDLLDRIIAEEGLDMSSGELANEIKATVKPQTVLLVFTVTDASAQQAQLIADKGSELLSDYIEKLETPRRAKATSVVATVTNPPKLNTNPVSPNTGLNLTVAAILGLLLGVALAAAREVLDMTLRSSAEVEGIAGAPVLASIAIDNDIDTIPLVTDLSGSTQRGEAMRMLRTSLQYLDPMPRTLVVTSAVAVEGKSLVATNLAIALAQAGHKTIVVDGDLRRPRVATLLGLDGSRGLISALTGSDSLENVIQEHAASGVHCLSTGPMPPNPSEVLQTDAMHDLIDKLRSEYDAVIIDAPPVLPVADASILAASCEGLILVVRYGSTSRTELAGAIHRLRTIRGKLLGVVLNAVPARDLDVQDTYYGYPPDDSGRRKSR